jgi:hypothetical protein
MSQEYKTKNEGIFAHDYIDNGQSAYMGPPARGVTGARNDLKNLLIKNIDKFDGSFFEVNGDTK